MNFLAHLHLAGDDGEVMLGSLLPDLVRGPLPGDLPAGVRAGVVEHRLVDAVTDTHPAFGRSRARLRDAHGRLSGVLVDLFYDHCLARGWAGYEPGAPLSGAVARMHGRLGASLGLAPAGARAVIERMISRGWLLRYSSLEGMRVTLSEVSVRIRQRVGVGIDVDRAVDDLARDHGLLAAEFAEVMRTVSARLAVHRAGCGRRAS